MKKTIMAIMYGKLIIIMAIMKYNGENNTIIVMKIIM
jgi:hypothetical protein